MYGGIKTSTNLWHRPPSMGPRNFYFVELFLLEFPCDFRFEKFPFDTHECEMHFGSYQYGTDQLVLKPPTIMYRYSKNTSIGEDPIILNHHPYQLEIKVLFSKIKRSKKTFSSIRNGLKLQ